MMKKQKEMGSKWVTVRFKGTERNKLEKFYKKRPVTTSENISVPCFLKSL